MKKRGQITTFIIIGIVLLTLFGLVYYARNQIIKKEMEAGIKETAQHPVYVIPIKRYAESCLKQAGDQGVWIIGTHGGYIDVDNTGFYGPEDQPTLSYTIYGGNKVPYYLNNLNSNKPSIGQIEEKLSRYILVEFHKCLNFTVFDDVEITVPNVDYSEEYTPSDLVDNNVSINKENIVINIKYPLIIKREGSVYELPDFRVSLPIRLGMIYDTINNVGKFDDDTPLGDLLSSITTKWTEDPPESFDLSTFNCDLYDPSQAMVITATNKDPPPDPKTKIILLTDRNTFYYDYAGSFEYRFAIKMANPGDFDGTKCHQEPPPG